MFFKKTENFYSQGFLAGKMIDAQLDSRPARQLLEDTAEFREKVEYTEDFFSALVRKYSYDYSVVYFLKALYSDPVQAKAQARYIDYYRDIDTQYKKYKSQLHQYHFVFVPGFAYKIDPTTGADFGPQRELFKKYGLSFSLVETEELGLTDANALIIKKYVSSYNGPKKLILVSGSKGGLDALVYLTSMAGAKELSKIHTWINAGGIIKGTLIADESSRFPKSILSAIMLRSKGKTLELVKDITRRYRFETYEHLVFPENLKMIHFQAILLSSQVGEKIKSRFHTLARYGPNDGLTLTYDSIAPGGLIISEVGLDHYFKDELIDKKTLSLAILATSPSPALPDVSQSIINKTVL